MEMQLRLKKKQTTYIGDVATRYLVYSHIKFQQYMTMLYTICEFLDLIDMRQKVMLPSKLCSNLHILSRNKYKLEVKNLP
jgi:hypothetical protein